MALASSFYNDPDFDYRKYWQGREYEDWAERWALQQLFARIQHINGPPQKKTVLDVGAGFGRLAKFYLPRVKGALLLEPADKLIKQGEIYLKGYKNFHYYRGNVESLVHFSTSFDIVLMIRVSHHLNNLFHALQLLWQVTAPGGFLIVEIPNKFHFRQVMRQLLRWHFGYFNNFSVDRRSPKRQKKNVIPFWNHSPWRVKADAKMIGWELEEELSVSNFRCRWIKKYLPQRLTFFLERHSQKLLGHLYFGPSIFFLFRRAND